MLCSLSGQVPVEPVVSAKSGHVFEKRLVLQYLAQNQSRCPITNDELDADKDLITVNLQPTSTTTAATNGASAKDGAKSNNLTAFAPDAASVPQLLALFQNEWDAAMLETFSLKKHLEKTRQELSHALYQHDAACRVIARLNADVAALRQQLAARPTTATATAGDDVDMDGGDNMDGQGLSAAALATIDAKQKALAKERKEFKKKTAPALAERLAGLADWTAASSHTLHDSDKPGVLCVAVDAVSGRRVATGGVDKQIQVFNTETQQLAATLRGHSKKVSALAFHPTADVLVSGSHDKTVQIWSATTDPGVDGAYASVHTLRTHTEAVTDLSVHATGDYVVSASLDAALGLHDLRSGKLVGRRVAGPGPVHCVQFHPDGGLFGTGNQGHQVDMWDLRTFASVAQFEGHKGAVSALTFSENGYQLASGAADGVVQIWDLRKLKSVCEIMLTIAPDSSKSVGAVEDLSFDASGSYLAVAAGTEVQVLHEVGKTAWTVAQRFTAHKARATGVAFAPDSSFLASTSMDRSLKLYR